MLTERQENFCQEYVKDFNGKQAAIRAGYAINAAEGQASRLLSYAKVKARIKELTAATAESNEDLRQRVIDELKKLAFSNIKRLINGNNIPLELKHLPDDVTAAVQEVQVEIKEFKGVQTINHKLKLYSKENALEKLAKHLGIFELDNKQQAARIDLSHLSFDELKQLAKQCE